jgi:hypothetical protein
MRSGSAAHSSGSQTARYWSKCDAGDQVTWRRHARRSGPGFTGAGGDGGGVARRRLQAALYFNCLASAGACGSYNSGSKSQGAWA